MGRTGSGGAGACARVCRTDPHARKRSAGASGSDAALIYIAVGSGSTWSSQWPPRPKERSPARSPGSGFTVVPGEHASRSAPGHGARPSQQAHRLGAGLPPLMGGGQTDGTGVSEEDAEPSSSAPGGLVLTPPPPAAACRSHVADVVPANTPRQRTSEGCSPQPPASSPDPGRGSLHEGCEPVTAEPEETLLVFLRLKWLRCPDRGNSFCGQKWDSPFKGGQRPFPLDRAPNPEPGHRLPDWPRGTSPVQGQGFLSGAG